jgi:hypothetical protein
MGDIFPALEAAWEAHLAEEAVPGEDIASGGADEAEVAEVGVAPVVLAGAGITEADNAAPPVESALGEEKGQRNAREGALLAEVEDEAGR